MNPIAYILIAVVLGVLVYNFFRNNQIKAQGIEVDGFITRVEETDSTGSDGDITTTYHYSKNMEAVATGFKRINAACTEAGVKYEFLREEYGFTVRFHRHCGEDWNKDQHQNQHQGSNLGANDETGIDWENRKNMVIELIRKNPTISRSKLANEIGGTPRQVERTLDLLKNAGKIIREGPAHGGKWIIID